jgi:hypothetical protein
MTDAKAPDRPTAIREVVAAACELVDHDDGPSWVRLRDAVIAYRRIPMEQTTMEVKR